MTKTMTPVLTVPVPMPSAAAFTTSGRVTVDSVGANPATWRQLLTHGATNGRAMFAMPIAVARAATPASKPAPAPNATYQVTTKSAARGYKGSSLWRSPV